MACTDITGTFCGGVTRGTYVNKANNRFQCEPYLSGKKYTGQGSASTLKSSPNTDTSGWLGAFHVFTGTGVYFQFVPDVNECRDCDC